MRHRALLILCLALAPLASRGDTLSSPGCDFDADGHDDLVTTNAAGTATRVWIQVGGGAATPTPGTLPSAGWDLVGCGDLDGDGKDDLVYDGANAIRIDLMDGVSVASRGWVGNGGGAYQVAAIRDIDGDGRADLILSRLSASTIRLDVMAGTASVDRGWFATDRGLFGAAGDLDGDGRSDVALRVGPRTCCVELWLLDGIRATALPDLYAGRSHLTDWGLAAIADVEGTGTGVLVVERQRGTGLESLTWERDVAIANGQGAWKVEMAADLDGDGREDLVSTSDVEPDFVRIALIAPTVAEENGAATSAIAYVGTGGGAFDLRQTGDFDGDARTDLAYQGPCSVRVDRMDGVAVASRSHLATGCDWTLPVLR